MSLKTALAFVALAFVSFPGLASATGIVQTGDQVKFLSNSSNVNAGPFLMRDITNTLSVGNPGGVADFVTFCIEYNETVVIGQTFFAEIADSAAKGGRSAVDPFDSLQNGTFGVSDPLSVKTAFLYREFVDGALQALGLYDPTNAASRDGMQLVIWRLEGEVGIQTKAGVQNQNRYVLLKSNGETQATAPVPGSNVAAEGWANDLWDYVLWDDLTNSARTFGSLADYDVKVMRMWSQRDKVTGAFSGYSQDQLVSVRTATVPEPVSTFSALLLGVSALGLARRRLGR